MSEQWYCPNCGPMNDETIRYEIHDVLLCSYCDSEVDMESTEHSRNLNHLYKGCYIGHCAMDLIVACPMQDKNKAESLRASEGIYPLHKLMETPEILWPMLRQYRHNYGSEEFIAGFDYTETCSLVLAMQERIAAQAAEMNELRDAFGIGEQAFSHSTLMVNVRNAIRRSNCLGRIENYLSVTTVDEDTNEPYEDTLLNWGEEPDKYLETFRAAIEQWQGAEIAALREAQQQAMSLLAAANCPNCDKSGAYPDNNGEPVQCQWCYEVAALPAQEPQQGGQGNG
jgi:hypothetical protein